MKPLGSTANLVWPELSGGHAANILTSTPDLHSFAVIHNLRVYCCIMLMGAQGLRR